MNGFGSGPPGVPASQHSIFIRGFPGDMDMSRIRDFFEKEAGQCTFDFFKQSADKSRLFVAVRFNTRDIARDTMVRWDKKEIFGHRVYMTWFKDIRRYVAYTGQTSSFPSSSSPRGRGSRILSRGSGRGGYFHADSSRGGSMFSPRGRGVYRGGSTISYSSQHSFYNPTVQKIRARARAPSVVPSRTVYRDKSKSRSSSRDRSNEEEDKRSLSSIHSRSNSPVRKTRSKSPPAAVEQKRSRSRASNKERRSSPPTSYKMTRKVTKDRKRHRNSSLSSASSGDLSATPSRDRKVSKKRKRRSKSPDSDAESTTSRSSGQSSKARSSPERVKSRLSAKRQSPAPSERVKPEKKLQSAVQAIVPSSSASQTSSKLQDDNESPAKSTDLSMNSEIFTIQKSALANVVSAGKNSAFVDNKKKQQQKEKKNSRYEYKEGDKELKLSSVTRDVSAENDRQKKISNLPTEKLRELHEKRKELEQSYKQDCDTFATVVKMLISKDPSLEDKLLSSLRDSLKDIGQRFITELNEFVDSLLLTE